MFGFPFIKTEMTISKTGRMALLGLFLASLSFSLPAQDQIRVMVHNILRYGSGSIGTCTPNSPTSRNNQFIDILSTAQPDIYGVNEIGPVDGPFSPASNVLINVLPNVPGKGPFYEAAQINFDGNQDICNMLWYNGQKLALVEQAFINANNARNIDYYRFYYKAAGDIPATDTVFLHLFLAHYMASSTSGRLTQSNAIMNFLANRNLVSANDNYIVMGDFNESSPNSNSMQALFNSSSQPTRNLEDPLGLTNWNQNWVWSQSTRSNTSSDCGVGGGLDDRFDAIFVSENLLNDPSNFSYDAGSYWVFGNPHSPNPTLSSTTRANLIGFSDHYPVIADFNVSKAVARADFQAQELRVFVEQDLEGRCFARVDLVGGQEGTYAITVRDLQGKVLREFSTYLDAGVTRLPLELDGHATGIYLLSMENAAQAPVHRKFVRLH